MKNKPPAIADLFYEVYSYSRMNNIQPENALDEYFKIVIWSSMKTEWEKMSPAMKEELTKRFVSYVRD